MSGGGRASKKTRRRAGFYAVASATIRKQLRRSVSRKWRERVIFWPA
jgi:hypothetical protein